MDRAEQLRAAGAEKGLCELWQGKLRAGLNVQRLSALFIRGIDFCIDNDYPTLDWFRKEIGCQGEPYGVYVDGHPRGNLGQRDVVLNGDCKAQLQYDGFSASRLYARHNSQARVNVAGNAHLTVDAFDNTHLFIAVAGSKAKVYVFLHGGATCTSRGEGIKIIQTNKQTY